MGPKGWAGSVRIPVSVRGGAAAPASLAAMLYPRPTALAPAALLDPFLNPDRASEQPLSPGQPLVCLGGEMGHEEAQATATKGALVGTRGMAFSLWAVVSLV